MSIPLRLLQSLAAIYLFLCVALFLLQDRLLFHPQPPNPVPPSKTIGLQAHDRVRLQGWFDLPAGPGPHPALLYFGGNAEETSHWMQERNRAPDWAWMTFNYRGYGNSEGAPSEAALVADALTQYDALAADPRIDPRRIVVAGRSLGSGIAVQLAARRPVQALILITPYDSMKAVAAQHYPWLPVAWLLRHPFDSLTLAPKTTTPALFLMAGRDRVIPPEHGRRLAEAWGGAAEQLTLEEAGHNDIGLHAGFWPAITDALARTLP
jgi:hypothetical protein